MINRTLDINLPGAVRCFNEAAKAAKKRAKETDQKEEVNTIVREMGIALQAAIMAHADLLWHIGPETRSYSLGHPNHKK